MKQKIALVHDYLCCIGGSDRIFQYICEEFEEADIFTLAYNPQTNFEYFKTRKIHTTWMNRLVRNGESFRLAFPLATYAMQYINLSKYAVVLSSSATVAKYVRVPKGKHICYCYIPTRAIWHYDKYFGKNLQSNIFKFLLPYLKKRDLSAAKKVDKFIAISEDSKQYIKKYYNRDADIINCPIAIEKFSASENKSNKYLIVSRLEHWKKVDYAIDAFNILGLPLRIIGTGKEESRLRTMAKSNIEFLGEVDDATLAKEYSEAKAVIFTPFLEYGLIPLEACASGTPVICYGKGGVTELMISIDDAKAKNNAPTAVFFYEQTKEALIDAVDRFNKSKFNSNDLVSHASKWSIPVFKKKIREVVNATL